MRFVKTLEQLFLPKHPAETSQKIDTYYYIILPAMNEPHIPPPIAPRRTPTPLSELSYFSREVLRLGQESGDSSLLPKIP